MGFKNEMRSCIIHIAVRIWVLKPVAKAKRKKKIMNGYITRGVHRIKIKQNDKKKKEKVLRKSTTFPRTETRNTGLLCVFKKGTQYYTETMSSTFLK